MENTEHWIGVDGLRLKGYFYAPEKRQNQLCAGPMLLLCHGIPAAPQPENLDSVKTDGGYPALAALCLQNGYRVFHFNFRGTGESEGNLDLAGWQRDLAAVLDYWKMKAGIHDFLLWGFSAGAAVACCVAARDGRVRALVMAASPAGFERIFPTGEQQHLLTVMRQRGVIRDAAFPPDAVRWLMDMHAVSPEQCIGAVAPRPVLIVHGEEDELVALDHAYRLHRAAGAHAELVILPGAGHQLRRYPDAVNRCLHWLKKVNNFGEQ